MATQPIIGNSCHPQTLSQSLEGTKMVKDFDKYNQRIEDALVANDKRIKKEEEARKALKNAKVVTKPPDDSNVVRSEQPVRVEDAKLANYMHDDRNKDGYVRPYIAWRYLLKQIGLSVTDIVADPRPENERAYPLLNCERHGHDIWKHQTQHNVTHQSPSTVTPGHLNFMYSKMVRGTVYSSVWPQYVWHC